MTVTTEERDLGPATPCAAGEQQAECRRRQRASCLRTGILGRSDGRLDNCDADEPGFEAPAVIDDPRPLGVTAYRFKVGVPWVGLAAIGI